MALTRREFLRATGGAIALAAAPQISFAQNAPATKPSQKENIRNQAAKWIRQIHHAGGGETFPGVFYFTEKNLDPNHWPGDSDDFWSALDETCELVVGEHYHSDEFSFQRNTPQLAEHF